MLKKLGLVSVGVTAGMLAIAPLASAHESDGGETHSHVAEDGESNIGIVDGNTFDQGNGEGNTVNGEEAPALPAAPDIEEVVSQLPDFGALANGLANGIPTQLAI